MNKLDILENKKLIGNQLLEFIKGEGYTKSSFAKMVNIKKEILNRVLDGGVTDNDVYTAILDNILEKININLESLLRYENKLKLQTLSNK